MVELHELTNEKKILLESREFIDWLLEDLSSLELSALLVSIGIEKQFRTQSKLPKAFLKNKLLLKNGRVKLREKKILPPFEQFIKHKEEDLKVEDIKLLFMESQDEEKKVILSLFLQNYYDEALDIYNNFITNNLSIKKPIIEKEKIDLIEYSEPQKTDEKKVGDKLTLKIKNLEKINTGLQKKVEELKRQNKEIQLKFLNENNKLKEEVALLHKKISLEIEKIENYKKIEVEKEVEVSSLNKKVSEYEAIIFPEKSIAFIGDRRIIEKNNWYKVIPQVKDLEDLLASENESLLNAFDEIHCLTFSLTQGSLRRLRKAVQKNKLKEFNNLNDLLMYLKKENYYG